MQKRFGKGKHRVERIILTQSLIMLVDCCDFMLEVGVRVTIGSRQFCIFFSDSF